MTKKEALLDLIDDLDWKLQRRTADSLEYEDKEDFWDLVNANTDTKTLYERIQKECAAYGHTPRALSKLIDYYNAEIENYHDSECVAEDED